MNFTSGLSWRLPKKTIAAGFFPKAGRLPSAAWIVMNRNKNIFNIFAVLDNEPSPFVPSFNVYRGGSSHQICLGENTYLPHNFLDIGSAKIPKQLMIQ